MLPLPHAAPSPSLNHPSPFPAVLRLHLRRLPPLPSTPPIPPQSILHPTSYTVPRQVLDAFVSRTLHLVKTPCHVVQTSMGLLSAHLSALVARMPNSEAQIASETRVLLEGSMAQLSEVSELIVSRASAGCLRWLPPLGLGWVPAAASIQSHATSHARTQAYTPTTRVWPSHTHTPHVPAFQHAPLPQDLPPHGVGDPPRSTGEIGFTPAVSS